VPPAYRHGAARFWRRIEAGAKAKPMIRNDGKRVKLPSIGWVRLAESFKLGGEFHRVSLWSRQTSQESS
jgi:hypothetical protein